MTPLGKSVQFPRLRHIFSSPSFCRCFRVIVYQMKIVLYLKAEFSFYQTNRSKSMIFRDSTAVSKARCACWYFVSSNSPSAVSSGMFMESTKSTFLLSTRKSAKRTQILCGTAELNLRTSWVPLRTVGDGVSSSLLFRILAILSTELETAELSSAKESKWNLGDCH